MLKDIESQGKAPVGEGIFVDSLSQMNSVSINHGMMKSKGTNLRLEASFSLLENLSLTRMHASSLHRIKTWKYFKLMEALSP